MVIQSLPIKILIAERAPFVAEAIAISLISQGYTIAGIAKTGEDAIQQVMMTVPDLVLMDINLQGEIDAIDAAQKIHSDFLCPVIYMSAFLDAKLLSRAKSTDAYGFLLKPFTLDDLTQEIEVALQKHLAYLEMRSWADEQFMLLLSAASHLIPMPRICFEEGILNIYVSSLSSAKKLSQQCIDLRLPFPYQVFTWEKKLDQYQLYADG